MINLENTFLETKDATISKIPVFRVNKHLGMNQRISSMPSCCTEDSSDDLEVEQENLGWMRRSANLESLDKMRICRCPQVLIADDDFFQHFYYQNLFCALFGSQEKTIIRLCFSGEELLDKLAKISSCGCNKLKLLIVDYNMGNKKLDGVKTCVQARRLGYKNSIVLRTSETKDYLKARHEDFNLLTQNNTIDEYINKEDMHYLKEILRRYFDSPSG